MAVVHGRWCFHMDTVISAAAERPAAPPGLSDFKCTISCSSCSSDTMPWNGGMIGANPATTFACGLTIDSAGRRRRRPASRRPAARPRGRRHRRFGPREAASPVWQVTQARLVNNFSPAAAGESASGPPLSQAWCSVGSITTTLPIIPVLGAAVLGAEQVIAARRGRLEPQVLYPARDHVRFHPERGDVEAVDHILGSRSA